MIKESETVEFKKSTSELKEAIISIVSILNKHRKGELYFGIKNDGSVIGQQVSEKTLRTISDELSNHVEPKIYPKIESVKIGKKDCIRVTFHGENYPYFASGKAYIRIADTNRQLSVKELESLILRKNRRDFENEPSGKKISDVNNKVLRKYIGRGKQSGRIHFSYDNVKNTLQKLGLAKDSRLNKAAEILFCDNNQLEVQAAVFAGTEKVTFLDIQQFKGNLFDVLERSESYIKERINWRAEIKGFKREEIPEVPISAMREAIVNSLCHRDYAVLDSNKIAIFKDRI